MKALASIVAAGALAAATGCSSPNHVGAADSTITDTATSGASSDHHVPSSNATWQASAKAAANVRKFVDAMADSIHTIPPQVVAGPTMRAYMRFEYALSSADAATGSPEAASAVSSIPGGYQLCASDGSNCVNLTSFTVNSAGQITGVSVNGQPIVGRVAVGTDSITQGLAVSDVISYRLTGAQNTVVVVFMVHDVSYRPINDNPAVLATFNVSSGQLSEDDFKSVLPSSLSPGNTVYGYAEFDTTQMTGAFELHSNDGYNLLLASSAIRKA